MLQIHTKTVAGIMQSDTFSVRETKKKTGRCNNKFGLGHSSKLAMLKDKRHGWSYGNEQ
jgi:hypothetical protein